MKGPFWRGGALRGLAQCCRGVAGEGRGRVYNQYMPDRSLYERTAATVRSQLGEKRFEAARDEGRAVDFEHSVVYAL